MRIRGEKFKGLKKRVPKGKIKKPAKKRFARLRQFAFPAHLLEKKWQSTDLHINLSGIGARTAFAVKAGPISTGNLHLRTLSSRYRRL